MISPGRQEADRDDSPDPALMPDRLPQIRDIIHQDLHGVLSRGRELHLHLVSHDHPSGSEWSPPRGELPGGQGLKHRGFS